MALRSAAAALLAAAAEASTGGYDVRVISRPDTPLISYLLGNTRWPQSFNPSWVEASAGTGGKEGLLVRSQNCSGFTPGQCISCNVDSAHPIAPYFPGSVITFSERLPGGGFAQPYLVFAPDANAPVDESNGTEDPRMKYDPATGLYRMFYTCYGGKDGPYLCQAVTSDPTLPWPGNWTRLGKVVPTFPSGSKSGALLVRPSPPHYLYWGAGVIHLATTSDFQTFDTVNSSFIAVRKDGHFDNFLVEAGPPPLPLSDGNLLFFYNSANGTGGDFDAYNPGWVVLSGADPTQILARSETPLLSPDHGWEQGKAPFECNVHNVSGVGGGGGRFRRHAPLARGLLL